ncbi:hypothetical protein DI14_14775 [Exiguobacterium sp. AB2]|nr:hypothetical protein DI14_14775 [Exiguobacterium sp. AB2]
MVRCVSKVREGAHGAGGALTGGRENIVDIDACFTRLRVELKDVLKIDEDELKALGAAGVIKVKNNIQAIFGGRSDLYKNELLKMHKEMDQAN